MCEFNCLNSGESLYLVNSFIQSCSFSGGIEPVTGFHSVMERPDSVSLVRPPKTTIPKIKVDVPTNQYPTDLGGTTSGLVL